MFSDFINVIRIITVFQIALVCTFLIVHKERRSQRNILLVVFIASKALYVTDSLLMTWSSTVVQFAPNLLLIGPSFQYLLGPALFYVLVVTTHRNFHFRPAHLLHLLPFLLYLGFIVSRYQLSGIETKLSLLHEGFPNDMPSSKAMILGFYLHFTVYGICALVMLSRTREELYRYTSQAIGPNIGFFKFLIYDFIVVWGINMISMYVWFGEVGSTLLQAGTVLNIFFIANAIVYGGLKFPHIFGIEDAGRQKYEKNLLSEAEKEHYGRKLLEFMETRKPYLEPTLSLSDLATQLAVPSHVLSQILNVVYQQNFYDFINSYRIEESKRLLCVPHSNGKTILEILYQCGFNSKSVFNAAFKKFTGMTPREFKRSSSSPSSQTVIPASFQ